MEDDGREMCVSVNWVKGEDWFLSWVKSSEEGVSRLG